MKFVLVCRIILLPTVIHYTESFSWTGQPANPTLVTKGVDTSLTWKFTLTANEQIKSQTFYFIRWTKFNEASSNYDLIGAVTFLGATGSRGYAEPRAPHIEIDLTDQATLLINNVRAEDEGTYKIEFGVQLNGTLLANHEVNVTVLEHPKIVYASNDQDVCEGSMVTLGCHATGKPEPNITWTRVWENGTDSDELPSVDGKYVISSTSRGSNGTYRCKAFNGVGDPTNQTVEVIVKYSLFVRRVVRSSDIVIEGHAYNLSCKATGYPMPNITWITVRNNQRSHGNLLNFTNINRNDSGDYKCEASNRCGVKTRTEAISVFYPPSNVSLKTDATNKVCVGTAVSFKCSAVANPQVHTYLLYENNVIASNMGDLGTVSRRMKKAGKYTFRCEANNSIQGLSRSRITMLTVTEPPSVQHEETKVVKEGDSISVYCNVSSVPPTIVSWRKLKSDDGMTNGHSLNISNISRCQGGEYRCTASNICGAVSTTVEIEVQYGPYVVGSKRHIVKEGHCATIFCPVLGKPPPDITWYKGNETDAIMSLKSTLEFQLTSMDVTGWYTCFAKNSMGNVTTSVFLEIEKSVKSTPTTPATTSTVPNKCQCSCNDAILKAIIGSLVVIIIFLTLSIVWLYRKGTTINQRKLEHKSSVYINEMVMKDVEQSLADSSTFNQPGAEYMDLKETSADNIKSQSADQGADYATLDPSTRSWEVERDHVAIEKIIGKGAFGQVAKGTAMELRGRPGTTTVAIKMLKANAAESDKRDLVNELETMKHLRPHPHVIKLLGCVTVTVQWRVSILSKWFTFWSLNYK
ncbi:hemicentin-2-like isoform X2 [Stylophora pistillata]|uniref:hemicentin-2-like isoform X2 n=1 Tax=Stylophora pistillata TaxID=50429 RepID=UPI000C05177E|nr:hemicentin-2-like isoform X2 [Stylophora pistillata]